MLPLCEITQLTKLTLVQDMAAVMLAAGLVAALFHYLGWPKVIGYIAAGTLMGLPQVKPFLITNEGSVNVLANLGVIFLMFTLGLELNIRRLRKIGGIIFPTAACDLGLMLLAGYALGRHVFHWDMLPSLFLGAVVCDSSTTLLAKSLDEIGCSKENFATVIFGITISEDVLTIGVMAILTGLAMTGQFQAMELAKQLGFLGLFLVGVMVFGLMLLPKFLDKLKKMKDDETLLIIILGICFGIAFIAEKMNFSLALGAFLVGAVVAESSVSARVHESTGALRNMFSAVFFVTIGLMVNPAQMWDNILEILAVTFVAIVGKTVNCMVASYALGQSHKDALKTGIGLAQIGDFAYLIALLGMTLGNGAEPYPRMYQIAVGVSVITTLINPFMLKASVPLGNWLDKKMPGKLLEALENYTLWTKRVGSQIASGNSQTNIKRHVIFYIIDLTLLAVIFMIAHFFLDQAFLKKLLPQFLFNHRHILLWIASCILSFPFMVSAFLHSRRAANDLAKATVPSFINENLYKSLHKLTKFIVIMLSMTLMIIIFSQLSALLFFDSNIFLVILAIYFAVCILGWKKVKKMAQEGQDILTSVINKEDDDLEIKEDMPVTLALPDASGAIGMTLRQLRLRNRTGASVNKITRASGEILSNPGPKDTLEKGDTLTLAANNEQLQKTKELLSQDEIDSEDFSSLTRILEIHVEPVKLTDNDYANGKSLKEIRLRNLAGTTVVRVEHPDKTATDNPGPDQILSAGDTVFVLGLSEQIKDSKQILAVGKAEDTP